MVFLLVAVWEGYRCDGSGDGKPSRGSGAAPPLGSRQQGAARSAERTRSAVLGGLAFPPWGTLILSFPLVGELPTWVARIK